MELFTKVEELESAIESIARRGKKLDSDIHQALCSAVWHRLENNDNTLIGRVIDAMPRGSRANAAIKWAEAFGGVTYNGKDNQKRIKFKNSDVNTSLEDAIATPFWELKNVNEGEEYSHDLELKAVLAILERRMKKAVEAGDELLSKRLEQAKEVLSAPEQDEQQQEAA